MKGYNIARVPEHIWDLPGEGQRVRGADFNVAAWIRVDSFGDSEVMADEVVLLVQHEDEAGVHRAVADRAHISEGGSALMAGLIHLRFTGEVRNVRVLLATESAGLLFQVDELFMQRKGSHADNEHKLISNYRKSA